MPVDKYRYRKKKTYLRAHPYTILTYLSRFTYLLIIPLLQHLLFQPQTLAETIATAGVNILFVLLILFTAVGEYQSIVYRYNAKGIYLRRGWFIKRASNVPAACIQSVSIQENIFPHCSVQSGCISTRPVPSATKAISALCSPAGKQGM